VPSGATQAGSGSSPFGYDAMSAGPSAGSLIGNAILLLLSRSFCFMHLSYRRPNLEDADQVLISTFQSLTSEVGKIILR
jgi:hypothetical protein